MAVNIKSLERAIIKAVSAFIGNQLSTIGNGTVVWQTLGTGIVANPNHIFTANTVAAAAALRDSYFSSNPGELVLGVQSTLQAPLVNPENILQEYNSVDKPAVIRNRIFSEDPTKTRSVIPDYPYASVDFTRLTDDGYELTERFYNESGDYVYRTHKLASYTIVFYGTSQDDVMSIANNMHMFFEVDQVRAMVSDLSETEARLRSKTDPVFTSSVMQDKYVETTSFNVIFAVLVEVVISETDAPPIQRVIIDTTTPQEGVQGGIFNNKDDADPLLHVKVDTGILLTPRVARSESTVPPPYITLS